MQIFCLKLYATIKHTLKLPQSFVEIYLTGTGLTRLSRCGVGPGLEATCVARRVSDMPARQRLRSASTAALDVPV